MRKLFSITVLMLILSFSAKSQIDFDVLKEKYKSDDYIILSKYKKFTIDINKNKQLEVVCDDEEKRLFLNNKAGTYSDDEISYSGFWELNEITAYTEIFGNKKSKKTYVKDFEEEKVISDEVFHDDIKKTKFYLPSLRERAISTINYRMTLKEPRLLRTFFFQSIFPITEADFIIDADENIDLGFARFNTELYNIKLIENQKKGRKIYHFSAKDVERLEFEDNTGSYSYFVPHIIPYIKSYSVNDSTYYLLNSIGGLFNWYTSLIKMSDRENTEELAKKADEIVEGLHSEIEKTKAIFKWVQQNIKYIAIEDGLGGFVPDAPNNVFEKRFGDCKGKSILLVEMLKAVDIKSHLTWVGTTKIPYTYKENHTPSVDNHMIVTYITPAGEYYFLDATSKNVIFGSPTSFIQGKEALICFGDTYEIKKVPVSDCKDNQLIDSVFVRINENKLVGNGKTTFVGYKYSNTKDFYDREPDVEKRKEYYSSILNKGNNKFSIDSYKEIIDHEKYKYQVEYEFSIGDYVIRNENELFINMNIFKRVLTKKIKASDKYEKHFRSHNSYNHSFTLNIPRGWKIDYVPENKEFNNSRYNYRIEYSVSENKIRYDFFISYNTLVLEKEDFGLFNDMIDSLHKSYKQTVGLVKK